VYTSQGLCVKLVSHCSVKIRYDTTEEYNVDSKVECDRINLTHETKTNASADLVHYRFKIREGRPEGIKDHRGKDL